MRAVAFALILLATSNVAMAEGYYGANVSIIALARFIDWMANKGENGGLLTGSKSNAFGAFAGYRLNQHLAGEVGVAYYDGLNSGNRFVSLVWTADLVGTIPLTQEYAVYAKAGLANASPGIYGATLSANGQRMSGKTYGFGLLKHSGDADIRIGVEYVPVGRFASGPQTDVSYQISVTTSF